MPSTLQGLAEYREEIRKSRFHTIAAPVADEDEAQAFIAAHRDASAGHNCWAWKCGAQYRFSDDGEPGGSAGRPILAAIEGQDMDCVAVLVSRWFGGIKLGTGASPAPMAAARPSACSRRRAASWSSAVGCASPVPSPTTRCSRRAAWRWAPAWRPKTTAPTASS